ncbi:MAG: MBL fold hydrolase [Fusobacteriales bacterium]|nr:MAG: MBL fold hydrolase [Fusobacteriales bacterium]
MIEIKREALGLYRTNCYVLIKENKSIIIDPGFSPEIIEKMFAGTKPLAILLTHGHIDHVNAVKALHNKYNIPIYMSKKEDPVLKQTTPAPDGYVRDFECEYSDLKEGNFSIDIFDFEIIETPGHTEGSLLIRYENNLFTGDTLFKGTIGRTDIFSSDPLKMKQSIEKIKKLNPDYIVYPGHSESTTLRDEFLYNPFFIY